MQPAPRFHTRSLLAPLLACGLLLLPMGVSAQEPANSKELRPILILNIASVERGIQELGTVFESAGRPDLTESLAHLITGIAGDLKGIDRTKPLGLMFFVDGSLPPQMKTVVYVPVDNLESFIKTMELAPVTATKLEENRYEISGRRGEPLYVTLRNGYVLATPGSEEVLDWDLPDPAAISAGLTSRFDLALTFQIRNFPPLIRDVFVTFLRSNAEREMQQRDNESDAAYKLRRANGMSMLSLAEQILRDGEQITIGVDASADGKKAAIELLVDAKPDSEFARFLKNIAGKSTFFEPLLSEKHPLSLSVSWGTDKREQDALTGLVGALKSGLTERLPESSAAAVERMTDALQATVDRGHIDAFLQFIPQPNKTLVLVGGLRIAGSETFAEASRDILSAVTELEGIDTVNLNAHQHQGVILHRVRSSQASDDDKRVYGDVPEFYFGVGHSVLWVAAGTQGVTRELDAAIDRVVEATPASRTGSTAPFQMVVRMLPWLALPPRENANLLRRDLALEAMEQGDDAVRIEVRPTNTGGRIRIQFDEGFVRLFGLVIAQQYDRSQL